jgi:drug/metabolite transporter (DMT)-like permease
MAIKTRLKSDYFKGFIYSFIAIALLSTNFITAKYCLRGFNVATFSFLWSFTAAFYSFLILLFTRDIKNVFHDKNTTVKLAFLGAATGIGMIFSWAGIKILDPLFASFIWRFAPVFTVILGVVFLNEKLLASEIFCFTIMTAGGVISAIGRWQIVGMGIIFTLIACFLSAIPMVLAKMKISEVSPGIILFYRTGIAAIVTASWALASGQINMNAQIHYWITILLGAFIGPTLSFFFLFKSLKYWDLSHSTIVTTIQPIIVFPLSYFFLGKLPVFKEVLGGIIILTGAFWFIRIHFNEKA